MWIVLSFTVLFQATDRFLKLKNLRINGVMHRSKGCLNGENYSLSFLLSILYYVNNKRKLLISFHSKPFQLYILIWNRHGHECSGIWNDPKKKSSPIYLGTTNLDTILMHWMSMKLADNFQIQAFMAVPVSYYFEKLTTHVLSEFTLFLESNLVSFNRTLVVPYEISKVNFHAEKK
jgi:hypothetical protein